MLTDIIYSLHMLSRKVDKLIADVASSCKTDIFEKYRKEAHSIASALTTAQLSKNEPEQENVKRKDTVCPTDIREPSRIHLHRIFPEKVSDFEDSVSNESSKVAENNNSKLETAFKSKRRKTKFETETKNFDSECISTEDFMRISDMRLVSSTKVSASENASIPAHSTPLSSNSKCVFQEYRNIDMKQEIEKKNYYLVKSVHISSITSYLVSPLHSSNFASSNVDDLNIPNQDNHCETPSNSEKTVNIPHGLEENDTLQSNVMSSSVVEDCPNTLLLRHLNETQENSSCDNYGSISAMPHSRTAKDSYIRIGNSFSLSFNDTTIVLDDDSDENPVLSKQCIRRTDSDQSSVYVEEIFSSNNNREIESLNSIHDVKVSTAVSNSIKVSVPLERTSDSRTAIDHNPLTTRETYGINVTDEPIKREESDGHFLNCGNSISDCIGGSNCYSLPPNKHDTAIGPSNSTDFANKNVCEIPSKTDSGEEFDFLIDSFHTPSTRAVHDVIPLTPRKRKLSKSDFYKLRSVVKEVPQKRIAKNKTKAIANELGVLTEAAQGKTPEQYAFSCNPQQTQNAACVVIDLHPERAPEEKYVLINAENTTWLTSSTGSVNTTQDTTAVDQPPLLSTSSHRIETENNSNREFSNLRSAGVKCSKRSAISRLDGRKPLRCCRSSFRDRASLTRYCGTCEEPLCSGSRKLTEKKGEAKNRGSKRMNEKTKENQIRRREKLERGEKIRLAEEKRRCLQKHEERLKKKIENPKTGFKKLDNGKADCDVIPNERTETDRIFWVASSRQVEGRRGNLDPIFFPTEAKVDRKIFMRQSVVLTDCLHGQSKESKAEKLTRSTSSSSMGGTSKGSDSETRSNRSKKCHWGRKQKDGSTEISKDVKQVRGTQKYRYNAESGSNLQNPSSQTEHTPTTLIGTVNSMTYVKRKVKGINRYLKTPSIRRGRPPLALKRKVHFEAEELSDKKARMRTVFAPAHSGPPEDPKLRMRTSVVLEDVLNLSGAPLDVSQLSQQQEAQKKQLQSEFLGDTMLSSVVSDVVNNIEGPFETKKPKVHKSKLKKKRERGVVSINSGTTSYELTDVEGASGDERVSVDHKKVPQWARGIHLKHALLKQCYEHPNGDEIFNDSKHYKTIDLDDVFCSNTPRYHTRTSSAKWTSPE